MYGKFPKTNLKSTKQKRRNCHMKVEKTKDLSSELGTRFNEAFPQKKKIGMPRFYPNNNKKCSRRIC